MRIQPTGFFGPDPNRSHLRIQAQRELPAALGNRPNPAADLARRLLDLREHLDDLRDASGTRRTSTSSTRTQSKPALAVSRDPLEVTTAGSPTTLQTSGLVGSPTSPVGLVKSFSGTSTSQATLDGTYDGSLGDQVELTFEVHKGGFLGEDDTEVDVLDEEGTRLDRIKIDKEDPGEVFSLSMGLEVSFSPGELQEEDTFTLNLSTSDGVVDPDQAFQGSGLPGSGAYATGFEQSSTVIATVGGAFEGAFDDTLRFEVDKDGIVGEDDLEIDVFDGDDDKIGTLKFDKELPPGTVLSLSNGLTLALSSGELAKNDQFEVSVQANDQVVFDGGLEVQAGTLVINDTAIEVDDLDTIRTLADKITASEAGVSASFDAASGSFLLTGKEDGPDAISLGPDDTGFFAAIGLEESQQVPGTELGTVGVTDLSQLEGLSSGTFSINGEEISVNVDDDTIDDVLARINSLESDVEATFIDNRLRLRSGDGFELQNGTSAFFDAVEIDTGLYESTKTERRVRREGVEDTSQLKQSLRGLRQSLGQVFALSSDASLPDYTGMLQHAIRNSFDVEDQNAYFLNSGLGLRFQLQDTTDVLSINSDALDRVLANRSYELRDFLSGRPGDEESPGLVESLSTSLDQVLEQLVDRLDPIRHGGLLLSILA